MFVLLQFGVQRVGKNRKTDIALMWHEGYERLVLRMLFKKLQVEYMCIYMHRLNLSVLAYII